MENVFSGEGIWSEIELAAQKLVQKCWPLCLARLFSYLPHFTRSLADAEGRVCWHNSVVSECTLIKIRRFSQEEKRM